MTAVLELMTGAFLQTNISEEISLEMCCLPSFYASLLFIGNMRDVGLVLPIVAFWKWFCWKSFETIH